MHNALLLKWFALCILNARQMQMRNEMAMEQGAQLTTERERERVARKLSHECALSLPSWLLSLPGIDTHRCSRQHE